MHTNEDYLDSLLNNVTEKLNEFDEDFEQKKQMSSDPYMTKKNLPPKTMKALEMVRENQFLREFERELTNEDADGFLERYEAELADEALEYQQAKEREHLGTDDGYMEQMAELAGIAGGEPEAETVEEPALTALPEEDIAADEDALGFVDTMSKPLDLPEGMEQLGSLFEDMDAAGGLTLPEENEKPELSGMELGTDGADDLSMPSMDLDALGALSDGEEQLIPEDSEGTMSDEEIMSLLEGGTEDEALADIGKMLEADEQSISLADISGDPESMSYAADVVETQKQERSTAAEKKKKSGFWAKLLDLLFGEDEDDEDEEAAAQMKQDVDSLGDISDENMEILRAMSGDKLTEPATADKKRKKKNKKKKGKDADKDGDQKSKKAEKPKKEKKPRREKKEKKKKPVTPREKPLPRGPVTMIWIVALSVLALILISGSLLSRGNARKEAQRCFDRGDYVASYEQMEGTKLGVEGQELYEQAKVLASVQTELDSYYSMMEVRKFDLALDCLVRALGRSELNSAKAEEWSVTIQMNALVTEITMQLQDQFNVTPERAEELYEISHRDEYSLEIDEILKQLGLK